MWSASGPQAGLSMAAIGSMSTGRPAARRKPVGAFIQPLTATTKIAEAAPESATSTPASQCQCGGTRFQP
jgi:hypothetical protein